MKRLIAATTLTSILLFALPSSGAPVCGDVNENGSLTTTDALIVLKKAVGQNVTPLCPSCGDGLVAGGEDCDSGNLNGKTCVTEGFAGGKLACATGCVFDTSGCYASRFDASGPTILDHQTGLEWEKKDNQDGSANGFNPHDADNLYQWSATGSLSDGTAFTFLLAPLNGLYTGVCYAAHCDWRLPSSDELSTILTLPQNCVTSPCVINSAFLPSRNGGYWTSVTDGDSSNADVVFFSNVTVLPVTKTDTSAVRAVRGGQ